ncbi:membrane magnesium transporter [Physcomitrium patens]|uniref:Uncharacterized protein n=1 Tax=Physcomitrium patens TaxID=3218 RepID=A9T5J4_PHYPA|nr:membrane magnesium transporter-like [Physcomitrium patens]PNR54076.1 hypothetical protein PHYPA_007752 [Physcomitrium patens]|eukprot:XP_024376848.1 membrane magnesium transporter-like [Physcomitrella patens]
MGRVDFGIGVVGALLLMHSAVSTIEYRSALKIREEDFTYPPIQVVVEVAVSLLLFLWAALKVPGSFLPILPDAEANRVTMLCANLDFMTFNHRGKLFEPEVGEAKFS